MAEASKVCAGGAKKPVLTEKQACLEEIVAMLPEHSRKMDEHLNEMST